MLRSRAVQRLLLVSACALCAPSASAGITGVCPDGSIFIAPREALIPCARAKIIEPEEVPPMRPEYLPRPYSWQVYNEGKNPNNAYNLVDQAREVRRLRDGQLPETPEAERDDDVAAPPPRATRQQRKGPVNLGLTDGELRDLFYIVELNQDRVPASFERDSAAGDDVLIVSLAWSESFESRLLGAWQGHGPEGRVLLFSAVARRPESFYANFTFSQGHLTFQPKADDRRQFGLLQGRLGALGANSVVLGYLVLPDRFDLGAPLDVYWNDRRIDVIFQP